MNLPPRQAQSQERLTKKRNVIARNHTLQNIFLKPPLNITSLFTFSDGGGKKFSNDLNVHLLKNGLKNAELDVSVPLNYIHHRK